MRTLPAAIASHLAARRPLLVHALVWITARDRATQSPESIGLWTGDDHQNFSIDGQARTYYGAGSILGLEDFTSNARLEVIEWQMQISPLHDQVIEAVRQYDARLAPIELHLSYINPETMTPLADPVRMFRGAVTGLSIPTPAIGGDAIATIRCASDAWRLTRGLTLKRSQAALEARSPSDLFRRYGAISGAVSTAWGEKIKVSEPTVAPAPRNPTQSSDWK